MDIRADEISKIIREQIGSFAVDVDVAEVGSIISLGDGIARVHGVENAMAGEMLEFPHGVYGIALNLEEESVGAVLLGEYTAIKEGDIVKRTGRIISVPVGDEMLGRVVNALGQPIDGKGPIVTKQYLPIERLAPGVVDRQPVKEPLQTGLKAIDAMVPIGRGQRELIIGDRQTGKTAVALDAILNQKDTGVICIYNAIGQKQSTVAQVVRTLDEADAMRSMGMNVFDVMGPFPSIGWPRALTTRPSSSSPTGTEMMRPVRFTGSPSLMARYSPRSTAPTLSSSRFSAMPKTPCGNSSISPAMARSQPCTRAMPSPSTG